MTEAYCQGQLAVARHRIIKYLRLWTQQHVFNDTKSSSTLRLMMAPAPGLCAMLAWDVYLALRFHDLQGCCSSFGPLPFLQQFSARHSHIVLPNRPAEIDAGGSGAADKPLPAEAACPLHPIQISYFAICISSHIEFDIVALRQFKNHILLPKRLPQS